MKQVLLAEDDIDFGNILKQYLGLYDFNVHWSKDGEEALALYSSMYFDICILDVMMPKLDGFSLAEKIIEINPETPFLFLTARGQKEDKLKGLKLGADDYIVKPFEADELVLRIQNILKRSQRNTVLKSKDEEVKIGEYSFNNKRLELKINKETQQLTEKEGQLLAYLFEHKNQLLKREEILKALWNNDDFFSGRSMDVFISRLRKYLAKDATIQLKSIRGVGLEFVVK